MLVSGLWYFVSCEFCIFQARVWQSEPIPLSPAWEEGKFRTAPALAHQTPVGTGMGLVQAGTPVHMWVSGLDSMKGISISDVFCLLIWYEKLAPLEYFCQNYCHVPGAVLTHWLHLSITFGISGSLAWNNLFRGCLRVSYISCLSGIECQFYKMCWRSMEDVEEIVCGFVWLFFCPFFTSHLLIFSPSLHEKYTVAWLCQCCFVGVFWWYYLWKMFLYN